MSDIKDLILQIKNNGSSLAFYKLVQLYENRIFTMCFRIIGNREDAEEAAQDVFLTCYNKIEYLDDIDRFTQWILKISYNKSIDYVRKKKLITVDLDKIPEPIVQKVSNHKLSDSVILLDALSNLKPEDSALINLYYQENMSTKEISDILKISVHNVKIRLFRIRNQLKKSLKKNLDDL